MKDKLKVLSVPTTTALVHNLSSIHGERERKRERGRRDRECREKKKRREEDRQTTHSNPLIYLHSYIFRMPSRNYTPHKQ